MPTENQAAGPERASLDVAALRAAVVRPGGLWRSVEVTPVTGSTNADLLARAAAGEPEGAVLVAEQQNAGRGRLGRAWVSPPRAALTFSVLLRPAAVPRASWAGSRCWPGWPWPPPSATWPRWTPGSSGRTTSWPARRNWPAS